MSISNTQIHCPKCGGYIVAPMVWHGTVPPFMCKCKEEQINMVGWICGRCGKSNSPYKVQCDCRPSDPLKIT